MPSLSTPAGEETQVTAIHTGAKLDFLAPPQAPGEMGRLGLYRVLRVLGGGGMGLVFEAEDPVLHRSVALKVMKPEVAIHESFRQRFLREAQAIAAIDHHHIVHIYQVGEDRGVPFIAMPLLQGETLNARLKRQGQLSVAEAVNFGKQIAEGLAIAHQHGLIHRDIKPANIWLCSDARLPDEESGSRVRGELVKILDFGLARPAASDMHLTQSGAVVGTPAYMSPEQAAGKPVDFRSDLFSLGSVLHRMLTGKTPFEGENTLSTVFALATETPQPVAALNPAVPTALSDFVLQLLAKDPGQRPASARAVADVLRTIEEGKTDVDLAVGWHGGTGSRRTAKRRFPLRAAVLTVVGLLVLVLGLLLSAFRRPEDSIRATGLGSTVGASEPDKIVTNSLGMNLVLIPAGTFAMGSSPEEIQRCCNLIRGWPPDDFFKAEGPEHHVKIRQPFYMGATEVTVGQFRAFVQDSKYPIDNAWLDWQQTDEHPVVSVTWHDAVAFCAWLSRKEGRNYRLPTEAEWEYCCRAGKNGTRYGHGNDDPDLLRYAWYRANSGGRTHPVGKLNPNDWGLYDMHGNAWEWCLDIFHAKAYQTPSAHSPATPDDGGDRVIRGGSWSRDPVQCRSAFRAHNSPNDRGGDRDHGFRVVLLIPPEEKDGKGR